jgi:DNA sulfur modification protein DndB
MDENKRIEILGKLITEKQIASELKIRKQEYFYESISIKDEAQRNIIKETYEKNGWEFEKDFKKSIKMRMKKSHHVEFEDTVWSLFALMGYRFLNKDRNFVLPYDKTNDSMTKQIDVFAKDDETILLIEC